MSQFHLDPYADLQAFNGLTNRLLEVVNVHLNDPYNDSESLKVLQSMVGRVIEVANECAQRKIDKVVAEQIVKNLYVQSGAPLYYALPELPSVVPVSSNKRKVDDLSGSSDIRLVFFF